MKGLNAYLRGKQWISSSSTGYGLRLRQNVSYAEDSISANLKASPTQWATHMGFAANALSFWAAHARKQGPEKATEFLGATPQRIYRIATECYEQIRKSAERYNENKMAWDKEAVKFRIKKANEAIGRYRKYQREGTIPPAKAM